MRPGLAPGWSIRVASRLLAMLAVAGPAQANVWQELVDADQALARQAAQGNLRAAFLSVLAEDSVGFSPGPMPAKQVWSERPEARERLEWRPGMAEISISGDLGYVVSPWQYTRLPDADTQAQGRDEAGRAPGADPGKADDPAGKASGNIEEESEETAPRPSSHGRIINIWQRDARGEWRLLLSHSIRHAEVALATQTIRRGALFAGEAPIWPVGMPELRKADLEPAGSVRPELVAADFMRLRDGRLPDGEIRARAFEQGAPRRLQSGMVISGAGDLAVTWGGAANTVRWLRVWRRPVAGDPPGLGWRLAVDLSQAAQKITEP